MFEEFLERVKSTLFDTENITFKVIRGIITPEFYAMLRIEGFTNAQINFRYVDVPIDEIRNCNTVTEVLELIFYWGQNDFQSVEGSPSVSVGDIIQVLDTRYKVESVGFSEVK